MPCPYESDPGFCAGPEDQVSLAHRNPSLRDRTPVLYRQEPTKGLTTNRLFMLANPTLDSRLSFAQ